MANVSSLLPDSGSTPDLPLADDIDSLTDAVLNIGARVSIELRPLAVETALFGAFSLLIILSTCILLRDGLRSMSNMLMVLACVVMYAMAATHWALTFHYVLLQNKASEMLRDSTVECLDSISEGDSCASILHVSGILGPFLSSCTTTALLLVNIVLSDAIVLWRAWILWSRSRVIQGISLALLLSTLIMSSLNARNTCRAGLEDGGEFVGDHFGVAAFVLSWATNVWSTSLISYKAWRHRRLIKSDLQSGSIRTQAEKILMLFVESGVLYCTLWSVLVAYIIITAFGFNVSSSGVSTETPMWKFADGMSWFMDSGLIHLIGMYPTVLVVLVSFERMRGTRKFTYETTRTFDRPLPPSHETPRGRVMVRASTDTETLDTDIQTHDQAPVLVIGVERGFDLETLSTTDDGDNVCEKGNEGLAKAV